MMVEALVGLPAIDLVIVGEGPKRPAIEALAREREVADRVRLPGHVSQDRPPDLHSPTDLQLLISTQEGCPTTCSKPRPAALRWSPDIDAIADKSSLSWRRSVS
jgi:glycosyltransferase involved in cell wall biosynthesis